MRRALAMLVLLTLFSSGGQALGADPQPYTVTLKPTGQEIGRAHV